MTEPIWLSTADAIDINRRQVERTGEEHLVRDIGLLESAIDRPRNQWSYAGEGDLLRLGTTLLLGIAQNHPFLQGNKRTGFHAMIFFLGLNGYAWAGPNDRAVADWIVAAIVGEISPDQLYERLRPFIRPR